MAEKTEQLLPVLDNAVLQEKASEYAMKGAIDVIKEFYTGFNSPYKKAIEEKLKDKGLCSSIDIPDIIGVLNESFNKEVNKIANEAIANSFIPLVNNLLTREEPELLFSKFLENIIYQQYDKNPDLYDCDITESRHGWLDIYLRVGENEYNLTLHKCNNIGEKTDSKFNYRFLGMNPVNKVKPGNMRIQVKDGVTIDMPFSVTSLSDSVLSYVGRLIISGTRFSMDTNVFQTEMFPDRCRC